MIYITETCPGTFPYIDEGKHIKDSSVSGITDAVCDSLVNTDTKRPRIGDGNFEEFFVDDDTVWLFIQIGKKSLKVHFRSEDAPLKIFKFLRCIL